MANTFNTNLNAPGIIAKAAAKMLADELQFTKSIDKADKKDYDGKNGFKAGATIQISKPPRYLPSQSFDVTTSQQNIVEEKTPLNLDIISNVAVNVGTMEFATEADLASMVRRVIKPAMSSIAADVEVRMLQKATQATYNSVGTAGSNQFTTGDILSARSLMNKNLAPSGDRSYLSDSESGRLAVIDKKGLFQSSEAISKQYKSGVIGIADGYTWLENELLYKHTNGNDVTGVAISAATLAIADGATSIGVSGLTANTGTVTKGSVFTIAGVNAIHPITKKDYGVLQQFTVTADATAGAGGTAVLQISPAINSAATGLQNVTALHVDAAAMVFSGAASTSLTQNLAFHKDAFRMVSVPLIMPTNAEFAAQETVEGITVSIVRDFDVLKREMVTRLDFLGGIAAVRPEWATRITA